jgi:hypothetical protein
MVYPMSSSRIHISSGFKVETCHDLDRLELHICGVFVYDRQRYDGI